MTYDDTDETSVVQRPAAAPASGTSMSLMAGDYQMLSLVACGGCGSVYRARHRGDEREAAVKVLHASLAVQPKMVERFAREVQVVNMLKHPSIVEIFDVGVLSDGRPYYAMEYLTGQTLSEMMQQRGRLLPDEVLWVLEPVCAALSAAHAAGVVHRDVKASNILVQEGQSPRVKLLDFGIAKLLLPQGDNRGLTSEGRQIGTITIMAPEQILGGPVDARTDVYALGVLLYRLLTGLHPFDGRNPFLLAQQHLEEPAPRPSQRVPLPLALDAIVLRCLEKRPERRYPTVNDFLDALREAEGGKGRGWNRGAYTTAPGVAIYLEVLLSSDSDEMDDMLSFDVGSILDIGESVLSSHGFCMALETSSQILGVRLLPVSSEHAIAMRAEVLNLAVSLRRTIDLRLDADPRVHVNICVHAGDVVVRTTAQPEVIGGALTRVDQWAPHVRAPGLYGTWEALEGVTGLEVTNGPEALLGIRWDAAA